MTAAVISTDINPRNENLGLTHTDMNMKVMMEAASTSETSLNFYQTRRRNSQEDSHFETTYRYEW
jgi:hypothetical protein